MLSVKIFNSKGIISIRFFIDLKDEPLDWPETYHFEAVRMSISAGNVQDYSVW